MNGNEQANSSKSRQTAAMSRQTAAKSDTAGKRTPAKNKRTVAQNMSVRVRPRRSMNGNTILDQGELNLENNLSLHKFYLDLNITLEETTPRWRMAAQQEFLSVHPHLKDDGPSKRKTKWSGQKHES